MTLVCPCWGSFEELEYQNDGGDGAFFGLTLTAEVDVEVKKPYLPAEACRRVSYAHECLCSS